MEDEAKVPDVDPTAAVLKPGTLPSPLMPIQTSAGTKDDDIDDIDDDDLDETLSERLWGLTEMFPEGVRSFTSSISSFSWNASKTLYSLSCSGLWVLASSAAILALPVMFETERAQMEEQQIQQQRQILLGPNAAVSGPSALPQVMPTPR